jgi:hypothetical protein
VNALRKIHDALVPGGLVIDTQPLSPTPPVETASGELGTLDMRDWARTIDAVDRRIATTIRAGLFAIQAQRQLVVTDSFGNGPEFIAVVSEWEGTRIDPAVAERIASEPGEVRVHQHVRLRVLRAQHQCA